eukprot:TRINITY_DN3933_c0_g1_i22.p1 TRINITY_DN3933_c0_g1~~TRINITY_DN3933_c0_g1_i22.p1  ORF type:complete len:272 (-),score=64.39 TRINITY_DN3933_c0_g1_i22:596-1411(-)
MEMFISVLNSSSFTSLILSLALTGTQQKEVSKKMFRSGLFNAGRRTLAPLGRRQFASSPASGRAVVFGGRVTGKNIVMTMVAIGAGVSIYAAAGGGLSPVFAEGKEVAAAPPSSVKLEGQEGELKKVGNEKKKESPKTLHFLISTTLNPLDLFTFHTFQFRFEGEQVWHAIKPSFFTQVICWVVGAVTGSLAFPWLVALTYNDVINNHPLLKEAVEVDITGLDLVLPYVVSLCWNVVTFGADGFFGFHNERFATATEQHMKFKISPKIQFH